MPAEPEGESAEHLRRVRRICAAMPGATEKLSHGAPTFFAQKDKGVFAMFVNNHHNDGHVAVWIPAAPGFQEAMIRSSPKTFFRPPYVGVKGWVGVELDQVGDEELSSLIQEAWRLAAKPRYPRSKARAGSL